MKTPSTMIHVHMNTDMTRKATEALAAVGLTAADATRRLFHRIADQAFRIELKVPNALTRRAFAEVQQMVGRRPSRASRERPPIPLDVSWPAYWQALKECDTWWKRSPYSFSISPPGHSWVGVIRKLRPSMNGDWSLFDAEHQKRLLGCAAHDGDNWALLGNMRGFAIKPVFGDPAIRHRIATIVESIVAAEDGAFPEAAASACAGLTALDGVGPAIATRLLTIARPDRCVSWNAASAGGLAAYVGAASPESSDRNFYGRLLRGIYKQRWFSERPSRFDRSDEEEAWSMRVALLDAFVYTPATG